MFDRGYNLRAVTIRKIFLNPQKMRLLLESGFKQRAVINGAPTVTEIGQELEFNCNWRVSNWNWIVTEI